MTKERDSLEKLQISSNIIAAIVIPIILAYFGWNSQKNQIESNNSKEFVGMAIQILSDNSENSSKELKEWAIKIIDSESPVRLTPDLKADITSGKTSLHQYFKTPQKLLVSPETLPELKGKTGADLMEYILAVQNKFEKNKIYHEALIELIKEREK